jgi:hypothetical protein
MSARTVLICALCMAFLLTQGLGAHVHGSPQHHDHLVSEHTHDHAAHYAPTAHVVAASGANHVAAHLLQGDIDLNADTVVGKLPLLKLLFALLAIQLALIFVAPMLSRRVFLPLLRPPPYRSRSYVLPPSQAPPALA